jgi:hydroxymethylpyrimidine pyrophosphatase-like HAD family hydrolase
VREKYLESFSRQYDAIALDYDGTLISLRNRTGRPSPEVLAALEIPINSGLPLVIITGRGESLLGLKPLFSRFDQNLVFFAMYNGCKIVQGSGKTVSKRRLNLKPLLSRLKRDRDLATCVREWFLKPWSLRVIPITRSRPFMDELCKALLDRLPSNFVARNSGYSVDVYLRSATKEMPLQMVNSLLGRRLRYLRIGDQGHSLGNDYELLNAPGGFSVGTLSSRPGACFPVLERSGRRVMGPRGITYLFSGIFDVE